MRTLKCLDCDGQGRVLTKRWGLGLLARKYHACPTCNGTDTDTDRTVTR